ncbi:Cyclin-dependent kinase C-2 [Asimina triloba]
MAAAVPGQLNTREWPSWGSRSVDCFEKLELIGEGTYGQVYMAREIRTGEIVALKKIRMDNEREGFPITAIREIKILKKLHHENVIKLKEIVTSPVTGDSNKYRGSIYMVFEYMDHDLTGLADRPGMRFSVPQIKCYMRQLLTGLHYCHVNQVLHRDIKGSNLLIDNEGNLKLADFGLARSFSNDHSGNLTNRVITLWYRPPELLLGSTKYGPSVDMWSVGCIFAELLHGKPILTGKNEFAYRPNPCSGHPIFILVVHGQLAASSHWLQDQLNKIFELCGFPDEVNWPGVSKMPWYNNFKPTRPMKRRVRDVFKQFAILTITFACFFVLSILLQGIIFNFVHFCPYSFDRHALELLERMLTLDPSQLVDVETEFMLVQSGLMKGVENGEMAPQIPHSLQHCIDLSNYYSQCSLPKYEASHEFQTKKKRQQQRQHEETAKRQKLQHPQMHGRQPPIQQAGQAYPQLRPGPNQPIHGSQPVVAGPSYHFGKPRGPSGGQPNRYHQGANPSGGYDQNRGGQGVGYSGGPYPPQGRGHPYPSSSMSGTAPRGGGGGYGVGTQTYAQAGQYGGSSGTGRGQNTMGGNRNAQYGWQQ